jgi:peptidoglycan/LPS O-acetylase OafA/YrhL
VIALPITLLLAVASWHLVEHPALRLKSRMTGPKATPKRTSATQPSEPQSESAPPATPSVSGAASPL